MLHKIQRGRLLLRLLIALAAGTLLWILFATKMLRSAQTSVFQYSISDQLRRDQQNPEETYGDKSLLRLQSLCNENATSRGPHQKVISFSFFGTLANSIRGYLEGIEINARFIRQHYPNWVMRVYHNMSATKGHYRMILEFLKIGYGDVLDMCYVPDIPNMGNLSHICYVWRFFPIADPLVDICLVRDLDSDIGEREVEVVQEWLSSGQAFHVLRDNPGHGRHIMAGLWGARMDTGYRKFFSSQLKAMLELGNGSVNDRKLDQNALRDTLWAQVEKDKRFAMQHDSYFCMHEMFSKFGVMRPFKSCRNASQYYNFVGARRGVDSMPLNKTCPIECRPKPECEYC